jgi:exodeoxyribonuclease VII large subunit
MGKKASSQWDFGELFPVQAGRRVYEVSELTGQVRRLLETQIGEVWVQGEVTNLRRQASGHLYFSLKDADAQLGCVLFRGETGIQRDLLDDGRLVVLRGSMTVYEPRGQYQLRVTKVELQGVGALQAAFERLKQKLQQEGLFDSARKRPLPSFPRRVGLVTSPTGAALRDVLHVVQRRFPALEMVLAPCRVQGQGAAAEIAAAIGLLNEWSAARTAAGGGLDLILVTRGGGSLEDLWAFNEEAVARAIHASKAPVVSAVGHEIDFTISDFVADLRAATPSAAAELITEAPFASRAFLAACSERLGALARRQLARAAEDADHLQDRLQRAHPRHRIDEQWQRWDDACERLRRVVAFTLRERVVRWNNVRDRWSRVRLSDRLQAEREELERRRRRLGEQAALRLRFHHQHLRELAGQLELLSPRQVLARGYSLTLDEGSNRALRDAAETKPGQRLRTLLANGEVRSVVQPDK